MSEISFDRLLKVVFKKELLMNMLKYTRIKLVEPANFMPPQRKLTLLEVIYI